MDELEVSSTALTTPEDVARAIRLHVEAGYPEEVCGGLLGRPGGSARTVEVVQAKPLPNDRSGQRGRRYLIGSETVLGLERQAESLGLEVIGFYHSHPDTAAVPSDYDREHAWPWYVYLILNVNGGAVVEARAWRLTGDRARFQSLRLDPRPFLLSRHDESDIA